LCQKQTSSVLARNPRGKNWPESAINSTPIARA
jgi:hypothetical protein